MSKIFAMFSIGVFALAMASIIPGFAGAAKKKPPAKTPSKAKAPTPTGPISYTKEVEPLLDKYCVGCHNPDLKKGGVLLETHEQVMAGGNSGPVVVPAKSVESVLYKSLLGKDAQIMPPKGNIGPTPKEIDLLKKWIDEGAKNDDAPEPGKSEGKGPGKS